jgi:hypothetical protein
MATSNDKLVARVLRETAAAARKSMNGYSDKYWFDYCEERANELDPPEDRATRLAEKLYRLPANVGENWIQTAARKLREEGL